MIKKFYIVLLIVIGFSLIPNSAFACKKNHSMKVSCKKEVSSKMENNSCCKTTGNSKGKQHNGCGGKCGHTNCNIPAVQIGFFVPFVTEMNIETLLFYTKKEKYFNLENSISSGFQSLWLIPKIA